MSVKPLDATQAPVTRQKTIKEWMEEPSFKLQIANSLPKHLTADRYLAVARNTINGSPKVRECTVESILDCIIRVSQLGIEIDGRRCHLIPFGKKCTLVIDYKGIAELVRRSGTVKAIHIDVVCEGDFFEFQHGTGKHLIHRPALKNRGKIIAAYSFVNLAGDEEFDVMDLPDILTVMEGSKGYQYAMGEKIDHPWISSFAEMAKKTAFRRHSKILPLSPEIRNAVEMDDDVIDVPSTVTSVESKAPKFLGRPPEPKDEPQQEVVPVGWDTGSKEPIQDQTPSQKSERSPKKDTKVEKSAEPAPSNVVPIKDVSGTGGIGDDDVPFDSAPATQPAPAPVKTGDGPNMIKLKALLEAGKVSIEEFEKYARNSSPLIIAEDKTINDISEAKAAYVLKIWPKIYATIKPA